MSGRNAKSDARRPKKAPKPQPKPRKPQKTKPVRAKPAIAKNVPVRALAQAPQSRRGPSLTGLVTAARSGQALNLRSKDNGRMAPNAGVGRMNKTGTGLEAIQAQHKNIRADPPGEVGVSKAQRWLERNMSPDDLLSPDARRYVALLDDPLNAPWGDAGETSVRPLVYTETIPPSTTKTIRCFGQTRITIADGGSAWVACAVGAGNIVSGDDEDGDDLQYAWPNLFPSVGGVADQTIVTLGAPNDGRVAGGTVAAPGNSGVGCFGYWYNEPNSDAAPQIETSFVRPASVGLQPLFWGSPVPLGEMTPADSSQYKFRPVAGGILVTPDDNTFQVGGHYDAMIIPQATNTPYVGPPATDPNLGTAPNAAAIYALPDHCIQRADASISVNWLPGRMDYGFLQPQAAGVAVSAGFVNSSRVAPNMRVWLRITPPITGTEHSFVLSYTGFYEIGGRAVQQVGSVPRPQPSLGAKVATSVQNNLNIELDDRSRQVTEGTTLEVMKDHPKIGPMVEDCQTMPEARSALDEIVDFGKELLPLVGMFL